jgi:uncharacterized membrane protein
MSKLNASDKEEKALVIGVVILVIVGTIVSLFVTLKGF